jgi:hypothetical protein
MYHFQYMNYLNLNYNLLLFDYLKFLFLMYLNNFIMYYSYYQKNIFYVLKYYQ